MGLRGFFKKVWPGCGLDFWVRDASYGKRRRIALADEIGVGIIGFGLAAKVFHAPFVSAVPGLRLKAFVERKGDEAAEAYPAAKTVRTVEALLEDAEVKLVVVATPNETHFALAKQCLEAGRHVVIDKPFAGTSAEAGELIELAKAKGLVVAPFHNRRWDGDFLTVKKILAEGSLGRLVTVESHFDRFRPVPRENTWKESGARGEWAADGPGTAPGGPGAGAVWRCRRRLRLRCGRIGMGRRLRMRLISDWSMRA